MTAESESVTDVQQRVLQAAYEVFRDMAEWPTHEYVDAKLQQSGGPRLWDILKDFPTDLVKQVPWGNQDRVQLRVRGVAHCLGAQNDLALFTRALAWLVKKRRAFVPSPTEYHAFEVTADEFRVEEFALGYGPSELELTKTFQLLMAEPLSLGGSPGEHRGGWTIFVPSDITRFADVVTVEHYLERLDQLFPKQLPQGEKPDLADLFHPQLHPRIILPAPEHAGGQQPLPGHPPRVFIVHGHDFQARAETEQYLRELEIEPLVLQDQPNMGRTVIEKFERNSEVDYAIVILTPDDVARRATTAGDEQSRARQNVIFELGYFIGALGRERVCLLYKPDIEIPSDLHGVVYLSLNHHDWKAQLRRELRAANLVS